MSKVDDYTVFRNVVPYEFGFELLRRKKAIETSLEDAGVAGLFDLIGAILASGMKTQEAIEEEAVHVAGESIRGLIPRLLHFGLTLPMPEWVKQHDGTYSL